MALKIVPKGTTGGKVEPPLVSSPSSENISRSKKLLAISVEEIEDRYKRGYIDAAQYSDVLRERAHAVIDQSLSDKGFLKTALEQTIKDVQGGWEDIVKSAKQTQEAEGTSGVGGIMDRITPAGLLFLGSIKAVAGLMASFKVAGHQVERWALGAGASPGTARLLNITSEQVLNFVPVGQTTKTGVKVIQGIQKIGAKPAKVAGETLAAENAIRQSLAVEGVEVAASAAKEGTVRLYRGESIPGSGTPPPEWITQGLKESGALDAQGRWFTNRRDIAEWYKADWGERGRITYVDVPVDVAEAAKVTKNPQALKFSADAEHEFFVAREVADQARVLTPVEQFGEDYTKFRREMERVTERQSHAETARLAKKHNISLETLRNIRPGETLTAPEMYAYLKALEPLVENSINLAKIAKLSGSEADLNAFAKSMSEFFTVAPIFRGAEVEAGRAVDILKETPPMKKITDMLMGWDEKSMANGDFLGAMRTMADNWANATTESAAGLQVHSRSLFQQFQEGAWPKIREAYYNLLLPFSVIPNTIGDAMGMANKALEHTVGGLFSADKAHGLVGQEGWFMMKGYSSAFGDGLSEFGKAFKQTSPEDLARESSRFDFVPHAIGGRTGQIVNLPSDAQRGVDNAARLMLRRGSYTVDALREGIHAGMSDSKAIINTAEYRAKFGNESLTEFVTRRVKFPNKDAILAGDVAATHHTYQDQLGYLAERFRGISQYGPLSLYFTFMKSPINLAKYAWNRTPGLQLFSKQLLDEIAAGGVKADEAIGRLTIANMQGMYIYQLAQEGFITGSGPTDPTLRQAWLATHQPYSIKTPWGWMPYANFEPLSTVLNLVTDYSQIHNQLDSYSAGKLVMATTYAISHGMLDKSWWRTFGSVKDVVGSIHEGLSPNAVLTNAALLPATTVFSGGPIGGAIKRGLDPIHREALTVKDMFLSRIPGFSTSVPPLRNAYFEPVLPPQNIAGPWLGVVVPFLKLKPFEVDKIKEEGDRLKVRIPKFPNTIGGPVRDDFDIRAPRLGETIGVEMHPWEKDRAQELSRILLRHPEMGMETALFASPEYQEATPAGQAEMYMDAMATYRKQGITAMTLEKPEVGKRVIQAEARKLLPFLQRQEQDALNVETQEAMTLFEKMAPEELENLMRWGEPPGEED